MERDLMEVLRESFDPRIVFPEKVYQAAYLEIDKLRRQVDACRRYFDHTRRVSVSAGGCDSGEMTVRMSLHREAQETLDSAEGVIPGMEAVE